MNPSLNHVLNIFHKLQSIHEISHEFGQSIHKSQGHQSQANRNSLENCPHFTTNFKVKPFPVHPLR